MNENELQRLTVSPEDAGVRIDKYLAEQLPDITRSYLQKLLKDGSVQMNGKPVKASTKIAAGALIALTIPEPEEPEILPEDIPLDILYEDSDVILINKPKDMVVHPAAGHYTGTLVNALMYHCKGDLSGINGVLRPGIVHRIDKDTTGVLIVCKNDRAHNALAEQLKEHSITRKYRAIVCGNLKEDEGTVDAPLGRHPQDRKKMAIVRSGGKRAVTHYRVLERFGNYTYIECRLETGRTHQIRVHMKSIGHPLIGDFLYNPDFTKINRQALHSYRLRFTHPVTKKPLVFTAPLPEDMQALFPEMIL
mgnify:CR=1 FL=1